MRWLHCQRPIKNLLLLSNPWILASARMTVGGAWYVTLHSTRKNHLPSKCPVGDMGEEVRELGTNRVERFRKE